VLEAEGFHTGTANSFKRAMAPAEGKVLSFHPSTWGAVFKRLEAGAGHSCLYTPENRWILVYDL